MNHMNMLARLVDELLQCVADPGYKIDSFTFQPLREARRAMLPGNPEDCHDPTCGGFLATPMPDGSLACTVWDCSEVMETENASFYCNGRSGSADDCPGCAICSGCTCGEGGLCMSKFCTSLGADHE